MAFENGTVFILGAGFTKAFLPKAPLVEDDYGGEALLSEFAGQESKHARSILELELNTCGEGKINVERLMTRLEGGMPYDISHRADPELHWFSSIIRQRFVARIKEALTQGVTHSNELHLFANHCLSNRSTCITFNYDDILDQALYAGDGSGNPPTWNPDRGYGFTCRVSESCVQTVLRLDGPSAMLLLKLHGSLNWRIPLGSPKPYGLDAIRHHEEWSTSRHGLYVKLDLKYIQEALEPDPFIIPPVLTKTGLVEQPLLRFLWSQAYEVLTKAQQVVFIGYSMPMTDLSAGYLFREGLKHLYGPDQITVVDYATEEGEIKERLGTLLQAYRKVFPKIEPTQFEFAGARNWVFHNLTKWLYDSKGEPIAFMFGPHSFQAHC
jgi:hypothetical protein